MVASGRLKQEDRQEFKANLNYTAMVNESQVPGLFSSLIETRSKASSTPPHIPYLPSANPELP